MSARKVADRDRKRSEREARANAGIPEPRQVDASIVAGLRAAIAIRSARKARGIEIPVEAGFKTAWVMRASMRDLCKKSLKGKPLDRRECAKAVRDRLTQVHAEDLSGAPAITRTMPKHDMDQAAFEEAIQDLIDLVDSEP
jgi:hypothetical protein